MIIHTISMLCYRPCTHHIYIYIWHVFVQFSDESADDWTSQYDMLTCVAGICNSSIYICIWFQWYVCVLVTCCVYYGSSLNHICVVWIWGGLAPRAGWLLGWLVCLCVCVCACVCTRKCDLVCVCVFACLSACVLVCSCAWVVEWLLVCLFGWVCGSLNMSLFEL